MNCALTKERISEYLDGYLVGPELTEFTAHVRACPTCRKELSSTSQMVTALKSLPEVPAPPGFLWELERKLKAQPQTWWQNAAEYLNRGLDVLPLRAMTVAAAVVLVTVIVVVSQNQHSKPTTVATNTENVVPAVLAAATYPVPVEFASPARQERSAVLVRPVSLETPTEFLMKIIANDPAYNRYQILPHPKGIGALIKSPDYLYEVVMDPAEFPIIQAYLEQQGGQLPQTLREAKMKYPIYIRFLPNPDKPLPPAQ